MNNLKITLTKKEQANVIKTLKTGGVVELTNIGILSMSRFRKRNNISKNKEMVWNTRVRFVKDRGLKTKLEK